MKLPNNLSKITNPSNQTLTIPNNFSDLSTSLQALKPNGSEKEGVNSELSQTTQIITYALIATAVVGIFVYQYIKSSEANS